MSRFTISISTLLIICSTAVSAQTLERSVLASYGSFTTTASMQISSTVGELMVTTSSSPTIVINQGFQQGNTSMVGVLENDIDGLEVNVFPNPTSADLTIELIGETRTKLTYTVFDISGKLLRSGLIYNAGMGTKHTLNLQELSGGDYFLTLTDEASQKQESIKLVKL